MIRYFSMILVWLLVSVVLHFPYLSNGVITNVSMRPEVVNIGSIFTFNSAIGKAAKVAIEAAVEDVNSSPDVLGATKLKLEAHDSKSNGLLGIAEALGFMAGETVAIIGPQSSVVAHVISHIASELQVPLLSFGATDPTLSSLEHPFFVRTTQNDLYQMAAIAEIIQYYEWREVIAVYVDDDYGRNGIAALSDQLAMKRCQISYKAPMSTEVSRADIMHVLVQLAFSESRILVLHTDESWALDVLAVAKDLGMMGSGYVWIVTNWLSTVLDTYAPLPSHAMDNIQGVITLRMYTPDSEQKRNLFSRWGGLMRKKMANGTFGLNAYGLYAYDSVWLLAYALDAYFNQGGNISFSKDSKLSGLAGGSLNLDAMSIFNGGNVLLANILQTNMTGVTGQIKFASDKSLIHPAYEVINVIGTGFRRIGYWSNYSGLSVVPPDTLYTKPPNRSSANQRLYGAIWPGQTAEKPRGWVFPSHGKQLRIGVLNRVSFREFVAHVPGTDMFEGYCIDVFTAALNLLPYAAPYKLVPFGDGHTNPSGTELVRMITLGVYDAAIGDLAIVTNRTRMVDFTQPYIESGLVVVAPVRKTNTGSWAFLRPFSRWMWCVTGVFFIIVGAVIWILEHRINDDFRGPPRRQMVTIVWFSISTLFFAHKENTISTLGRLVLIIWLFVVLIINSSYTASLTSILTVQKLSSPIKGIESLITGNEPIGYQQGSFVKNYLIEELGIHESRLVPLNSSEDYARRLTDGPKNGGVTALVDERAYVDLFLSTHCQFSVLGQEFTKNGWGFAFPRDSPLAVDMSTAILKLSENGDLQRIHDKWLTRSTCSSQATELGADHLQLRSFSGLFLVSGLACLLALLVHFIVVVRQFSQQYSAESESSDQSSRSSRLQTFLSFVDEKEEAVKDRSKRGKVEGTSIDGGESKNVSNRSAEFSSNRSVSFSSET